MCTYSHGRTHTSRPSICTPIIAASGFAQRSVSHGSGCSIWRPSGIDLLPEISGAAQQRDEDDRQLEVGTRTHRVAREHAQTAGVGMHFDAERHLHREIGNAGLRQESAQVRSCYLGIGVARPLDGRVAHGRVYTTAERTSAALRGTTAAILKVATSSAIRMRRSTESGRADATQLNSRPYFGRSWNLDRMTKPRDAAQEALAGRGGHRWPAGGSADRERVEAMLRDAGVDGAASVGVLPPAYANVTGATPRSTP